MTHIAPQDQTPPLTRAAFAQAAFELHRTLPEPASDTSEAYAQRDDAAIAQVAALRPVNAEEVALAIQHVLGQALAMETMRLSRNPALPPVRVMLCHAQFASLMRGADAALRSLHRMQAEREKCDAPRASAVARTQQHATDMLVGRTPEPAPPPIPLHVVAPEPTTEPVSEPDAPAERLDEQAQAYASLHPDRTAMIRWLGAVPPDAPFDRPADDIVQALLALDTPMVREIDDLMANEMQEEIVPQQAAMSR